MICSEVSLVCAVGDWMEALSTRCGSNTRSSMVVIACRSVIQQQRALQESPCSPIVSSTSAPWMNRCLLLRYPQLALFGIFVYIDFTWIEDTIIFVLWRADCNELSTTRNGDSDGLSKPVVHGYPRDILIKLIPDRSTSILKKSDFSSIFLSSFVFRNCSDNSPFHPQRGRR